MYVFPPITAFDGILAKDSFCVPPTVTEAENAELVTASLFADSGMDTDGTMDLTWRDRTVYDEGWHHKLKWNDE